MEKGKTLVSDVLRGKEIFFQPQLFVNHAKRYKSIIFRSGKTAISLSYDKTMLFITTDKDGIFFDEFKISFIGKPTITETTYGTAQVHTLLDWSKEGENIPRASIPIVPHQIKKSEQLIVPKVALKDLVVNLYEKPELFTKEFCKSLDSDQLKKAYITFREHMAQQEVYEDAVNEIKNALQYRMGGFKEFCRWRDQL